MRRAVSAVVLMALACAAQTTPAWAWGATGHRLIGLAGAQALPPELPAFLHKPETIAALGELAREPDRSKGSGNPHDSDLNPGHFADFDDQGNVALAPAVALSNLPSTRAAYEAALHAAGTDGYVMGYLPYSLMEGWQQLAKDFAYWRVEHWALAHAKTGAARRWLAADLKLREQITIRDLGYWSHFVGDASQPLHVSMHYDGWGNFPNPDGFTTARVHGPFEGEFVHSFVDLQDVKARMRAPADCGCSIQQRTQAYLGATLSQVRPFYELEKAGGFKDGDPRGRAFAADRLAAGASELRDLVTAAWTASATISVGYPAVLPADVEAGKVDALGPLQGED